MLNPATSATLYFPSEPNWGTFSNTPATFTGGGGGGTTIVCSTQIVCSTIINNITNTFTINNNSYSGVLTFFAGSESISSGAVSFADANGVTFGMTAGTVTASVAPSGGAFSASGGSSTFATLPFANSNGFTFINSNGSVVGSYSNKTIGLYMSSNTLYTSSGTVDARSMTFRGEGIASVGYNAGQVVVNVPDSGGGFDAADYRADTLTQTAADPGVGDVKWNNATQLSATEIYIDDVTDLGVDISSFLALVTPGTILRIQRKGNADQYQKWLIDSITDNTGWWTLGVTLLDAFGVGFSNNQQITLSIGSPSARIAVSAGASSNLVNSLVYSNSNGVSFGLNGSTITASHNGLTSQSAQALSGSNGSFAFQTASFGTLNGISFYTSNGSMVASHNALTSQSNQAVSGSNGSFTFQTVTFGDLNGVSFYTTNGSMVASVSAAPSMTFEDFDNSSFIASYVSFDYFGTWASPNVGVGLQFATDTNGATLYAYAPNGQPRITYDDPIATPFSADYIFADGSAASGNVSVLFSTHTASFGSATIYASAPVMTFGDGVIGTHTANSVFLDIDAAWSANAIGLFMSTGGAGQITMYAYNPWGPPPYLILADSANPGISLGYLSLDSGASGVGFEISTDGFGAGTLYASHNGLTSQSNQAISGSNGSFTFQTATFGNLNGFSFYTSNGSMVGSYTVPTQSAQTLGLYASSQTTGESSSSTVDARSFSIRGAGMVSVGLSGGEFLISTPVLAGTGFTSATTAGTAIVGTLNTAGLSVGVPTFITNALTTARASTDAVGLNTAQSNVTWTVNSSGISLDARGYAGTGTTFTGTNASASITNNSLGINMALSVGRDCVTYNGFVPFQGLDMTLAFQQASLLLYPIKFPDFQYDRIVIPMQNTNATNSTGTHTLSFWVGIYTRNVSTLSLLTSTSSQTTITQSGTVNNYSNFSGLRLFTIPMTSTFTAGDYWLGHICRSTSGGTNGTYLLGYGTQGNSNFVGHFGVAHNTTVQFNAGMGVYNTTTAGLPNSILFNEIRGSDLVVLRPLLIQFISSTY